MELQSPGKIRKGFMALGHAGLLVALCGCASAPAGERGAGREPITVHVDNLTSRVITVDRIVAVSGSPGSAIFGETRSQGERPVTRRVGLVNGKSRRTLTVPWHSSRLAHPSLGREGVGRVGADSETLGPSQHNLNYRVEECRGQGLRACVETTALHLPPGARVTLVVDQRHVATLYYDVPTEEVGRTRDGVPLR